MKTQGAYSACMQASPATALVSRHAELVKRIAYHLAGRLPASVEVDDLIQAGMVGLLEAASGYSPDRGASFETYAGIRIRGAMIDALRKLDWAPRSVHRKARDAAAAIREVESAMGREARDTEIAQQLGVSLEEYHRIAQDAAGCRLSSMDEMVEGAEAVDRDADLLAEAESGELRKSIAEAITKLPERERLIMSMYYDDELNMKEIGAVLNISESRVCQMHGQALVRLRARLKSWHDPD